MAYIPIYITTKFVYRLQEFLTHWYVGGFKVISHWAVSFLERLDRTFALQVTARYIFEPLYQDRTILGYILGFVFRSFRIVLTIVIYLLVVTFFVAIYLGWMFLLPYIFYRAVGAVGLGVDILSWIR